MFSIVASCSGERKSVTETLAVDLSTKKIQEDTITDNPKVENGFDEITVKLSNNTISAREAGIKTVEILEASTRFRPEDLARVDIQMPLNLAASS